MTIPQIAHKYGISEAYLNAKDDAIQIAAASLVDLKGMVTNNVPREQIANKLGYIR
jgi:hypothetical protein